MDEVAIVSRAIPILSDAQKTLNARIKSYLESVIGFSLTDKHIFKLELEHNGVVKVARMSVEIGSRFYQDEPVIAIFESRGWLIVCTKSRGALIGSPLYIDADDVVGVIEFKA